MKIMPKGSSVPLLICLFLITTGFSFAQADNNNEYLRRYINGTQYYEAERWYEAAAEFRNAQENSKTVYEWSQALYWVILSELAYTDYGSALRDMDELERRVPNSDYTRDMYYHRGRAYFNLGYFEDALLLFRRYINSVTPDDPQTTDRIAAAYFWMGECLYSMGQFDDAVQFYTWVVDRHPESPKYEISLYRLDLIKQKKIEAELLALLQWSHEESLRTSEDYHRRIRTYEQTLNTYQRRIAELLQTASTLPSNQQFNVELPPPIEFTIPDNLSDEEAFDYYESLLERARRLMVILEDMIRDYDHGGFW